MPVGPVELCVISGQNLEKSEAALGATGDDHEPATSLNDRARLAANGTSPLLVHKLFGLWEF